MIKSAYITALYKTKPKANNLDLNKLAIAFHSGEGGILLHEVCGHAFELDNIKKGSYVSTILKKKSKINANITIIDDPTIPGLSGTYRLDDEGQQGRKKVLVSSGVLTLRSYLSNLNCLDYNIELATGNGRRSSYEERPLSRM
ncbi:MAG: hypothetical protein KAX49_14800 [Halanaerobiales bacterium]|nr:hypothetical protein [Halanaerobiales bacterium]